MVFTGAAFAFVLPWISVPSLASAALPEMARTALLLLTLAVAGRVHAASREQAANGVGQVLGDPSTASVRATVEASIKRVIWSLNSRLATISDNRSMAAQSRAGYSLTL